MNFKFYVIDTQFEGYLTCKIISGLKNASARKLGLERALRSDSLNQIFRIRLSA